MLLKTDPVHAFMPHAAVRVAQAAEGRLCGLTVAVKDIFDVAGYPTGCGNPMRLQDAVPAKKSAPAVQSLFDAGAEFVGKTKTDELAFSLTGINAHYGMPVNVAAEGRIPGGSSSGSAAAVAAGLVDFATGSDTGGSIRAPASYCGLIGLRPTWGRITLSGTMPLADSFDVFGWFARDMQVFKQVAATLMGHYEEPTTLNRLMIASDLMALVIGEAETKAHVPALDACSDLFGKAAPVEIAKENLEDCYWAFRRLQSREAWHNHGEWIENRNPNLGPGVRERFEWSSRITASNYKDAMGLRRMLRKKMTQIMGADGLLILPTVPGIAPRADDPHDQLEDFRERALRLLCISGLTGLPQISIPVATLNGCPFGLSLMAPAGRDRALIAAAARVMDLMS